MVEAQKLKAVTTDVKVNDAGLGLLRLQPEFGQQLNQARERPFGLTG